MNLNEFSAKDLMAVVVPEVKFVGTKEELIDLITTENFLFENDFLEEFVRIGGRYSRLSFYDEIGTIFSGTLIDADFVRSEFYIMPDGNDEIITKTKDYIV